jgi:hypothetical protein
VIGVGLERVVGPMRRVVVVVRRGEGGGVERVWSGCGPSRQRQGSNWV